MDRMVQRNQATATQPIGLTALLQADEGSARLGSLLGSASRPFVLVSEREISVLRRGLTKDGWKRSLYLRPATDSDCVYVGAGLLSVANRSLDADMTSTASYPHPQSLARDILCLSLAYAIEKDRAYAEKAVEALLGCAGGLFEAELADGGDAPEPGDQARWSIALAQAYDLVYYLRSMSDGQRKHIETELLHAVALRLKGAGSAGVDGPWNVAAVGVIGLATKDEVLVKYALEAFASLLSERLGDDGLWPNSPTRHFSALSAFVHLAEGCYRAGIDLYSWEGPNGKSLRMMFAAPLQSAYPSFRLVGTEAGSRDAFLPVQLYEIAYRRWDDQAFAWALKKAYKFGDAPINPDQRAHLDEFARGSFYAFLFGRDLPGRVRPPGLRSTDMPSFGMCTLRGEEDTMATLHYGSADGGPLDVLGFTFYGGDELVISDHGCGGSLQDIPGPSVQAAARNCVVVDGLSQQAPSECGLVSRYSGTFLQCAEASASGHYPGVRQTRRVVVVGGSCLISDELTSDTEHDYDWMACCEGSPMTTQGASAGSIDASRHPAIDLKHTAVKDGMTRIDFQCQQSILAMAMWTRGGETVASLGSVPAEADDRHVPLVLCRTRGQGARFTALLAVADEPVELGLEAGVFAISSEGGADYVYLSGEESEAGALRTDGCVAAVRVRDDEVTAVALVGGSWISWMGEMLLQCPATVDCVEVYFGERYPTIKYCSDTAGVLKLRTRARAMRLNGHRTAATAVDGQALLRVMPQMLGAESLELRS